MLLISIINILSNIIYLLVIAYVILSYFMSPFHPVRQLINRLVDPMLNPIRRVLPQTGMIDFSPMVLIILIWILGRILVGVLM